MSVRSDKAVTARAPDSIALRSSRTVKAGRAITRGIDRHGKDPEKQSDAKAGREQHSRADERGNPTRFDRPKESGNEMTLIARLGRDQLTD